MFGEQNTVTKSLRRGRSRLLISGGGTTPTVRGGRGRGNRGRGGEAKKTPASAPPTAGVRRRRVRGGRARGGGVTVTDSLARCTVVLHRLHSLDDITIGMVKDVPKSNSSGSLTVPPSPAVFVKCGISTTATRQWAYRRPLTDAEIEELLYNGSEYEDSSEVSEDEGSEPQTRVLRTRIV